MWWHMLLTTALGNSSTARWHRKNILTHTHTHTHVHTQHMHAHTTHACTQACTYAQECTATHTCIHMHTQTCMHTSTCIYMHTNEYTHMHTCIHTCTHMYTQTYIHTSMSAHGRTHTHTNPYTHTDIHRHTYLKKLGVEQSRRQTCLSLASVHVYILICTETTHKIKRKIKKEASKWGEGGEVERKIFELPQARA